MPGVGVGGGESRGSEKEGHSGLSGILREPPALEEGVGGKERAPALTWPPSLNLWGLAKPARPRPPQGGWRGAKAAPSPRPGWDRPLQSGQGA